jgi:putative SOS response-associated peptidase YedK
MCYHASVSATYDQLELRYERPFLGDVFPSFSNKTDIIAYHLNGFDFPLMPIITQENPEYFDFFQWGLIPAWIKDFENAKAIRAQTLNAKSETVFEKPSFRNSIIKSRCLIPVTGFFEWKQEDSKTKIPYFISLKNEPIFSLAGISSKWFHPAEDKVYKTFSIITTSANPLMEKIHNTKKRMPLILNKEEEKFWLDPNLDMDKIIHSFQIFDENKMDAYTISNLISSRKINSNVAQVLSPYSYERRDLFS